MKRDLASYDSTVYNASSVNDNSNWPLSSLVYLAHLLTRVPIRNLQTGGRHERKLKQVKRCSFKGGHRDSISDSLQHEFI